MVWEAANGRPLLTLKGHTDLIYSVAFSPDGQRIVTGSGRPLLRGVIRSCKPRLDLVQSQEGDYGSIAARLQGFIHFRGWSGNGYPRLLKHMQIVTVTVMTAHSSLLSDS